MRKSILLALMLSLFTLTVFSQVPSKGDDTAASSPRWQLHKQDNYQMHYPIGWELNTAGQMGTSFITFSPLASDQDQFRENVNLLIQDLSGHNLNLDQYVEITVNQVNTIVPDGRLIESKRLIGKGHHFQKMVYTGTQGGFSLKFEQYFWVVNDKAYVLTFTAEENQYEAYKALGEKMLQSFYLKM